MPPAASEFTAHSADAQIACYRRGSGAPILLIQGVAGHHRVWGERFVSRLANELDVITYDHRGIGDSTAPAEFTLDDLVADAVAVLDWAGISDAHVLGFSMGGTIAQRLAIEHPERVRSLTLVGTWADTDNVFGEGVLSFAAAGQAADLDTATFIMFEANVSAPYAAVGANFRPFRDAALSVRVPTPVVMQQVVATAAHNVINRLGSVTVPTLVVHGTQDAIINVAAGERIAGAIPGAHLELWPGLAHNLSWEVGDRLADAVLKHLPKAGA